MDSVGWSEKKSKQTENTFHSFKLTFEQIYKLIGKFIHQIDVILKRK